VICAHEIERHALRPETRRHFVADESDSIDSGRRAQRCDRRCTQTTRRRDGRARARHACAP
jgi:hypothetical protein